MANTNVTLPASYQSSLASKNFYPLGCNTKWTIPYSQVNTGTGSSDTVTVALGSTPAKWLINSAYVYVDTAFAGTTSFSLVVGTTTTTNAMIATADLISVGAGPLVPASGVPVSTNLKGTSAIALQALFTNATGGSPSALTAGNLTIYANVVDLTKIG